jgi:sulfur carrier protein
VKIRLNGQEREVAESATVADLLLALGLGAGVAVAVDRQVVPRSAHARTALAAGAEVEVIRAVGGG